MQLFKSFAALSADGSELRRGASFHLDAAACLWVWDGDNQIRPRKDKHTAQQSQDDLGNGTKS